MADINRLTPLDALTLLAALKKDLGTSLDAVARRIGCPARAHLAHAPAARTATILASSSARSRRRTSSSTTTRARRRWRCAWRSSPKTSTTAAPLLGIPAGRTHVVLVDQDDEPNGFTTVLPYNLIEIDGEPPDGATHRKHR